MQDAEFVRKLEYLSNRARALRRLANELDREIHETLREAHRSLTQMTLDLGIEEESANV